MFITHDAFKSKFSDLFGLPMHSHWTAAELALNQIWFIATISCVEGSGDEAFESRRTLFLSDFHQVKDCVDASEATQQKLLNVNVVTPAFVNGSRNWKIDRLAKIWSATEPEEPSQIVQIYETVSGDRYSCSMLDTATEDLEIMPQHIVVPDIEH